MSAAMVAKSAKARAGIAVRLLKSAKPWPRGFGLGRNFDDCFEMGDGNEVHRLAIDRAVSDEALRKAMAVHGCNSWLDDVRARAAELLDESPAPDMRFEGFDPEAWECRS